MAASTWSRSPRDRGGPLREIQTTTRAGTVDGLAQDRLHAYLEWAITSARKLEARQPSRPRAPNSGRRIREVAHGAAFPEGCEGPCRAAWLPGAAGRETRKGSGNERGRGARR